MADNNKKKFLGFIPVPSAIGVIAASHGASLRLSGILVSGGYYFALSLSAVCTCIGVAHNATQGGTFKNLPDEVELGISFFLGVLLAFVFAGLTISSIRKVREAKHWAMSLVWSVPLITGMGFSTLADHEAWSLIFVGENGWKAWVIAAGVSFVIFCLEIAPKSHEENVRESVSRNPVIKQARDEEINEMIDDAEFSSLTRNLSADEFKMIIDADGQESLRALMQERMRARRQTVIVNQAEPQTDALPTPANVLRLPAPAQDAVTTGEFTTASNEAQLLYKTIQARPDVVSEITRNLHAPIPAHVNFLARAFPGIALSEESVADVIAILNREEQDTDKLVSTDEIQKPSVVGALVLKYGKAIAKEAQQNPRMLAAMQQAQADGLSLVEIGKIASSHVGPEHLQHACLVPGNMRIALDTLNSQPPQTPTIPAINTDALRLYEVIQQAPGLSDKIWSYRDKPLSDLAGKLTQFFPDLQIDEEVVSQVLTLIHKDMQAIAEAQAVEDKPAAAPRKQHLSGPRNGQVSGPLKKARTTQATGTRKKVKMDTPSVAPRAKWTPAVEAEMVALVMEDPNVPLRVIQELFGVSENTARTWKQRALAIVAQMQNA